MSFLFSPTGTAISIFFAQQPWLMRSPASRRVGLLDEAVQGKLGNVEHIGIATTVSTAPQFEHGGDALQIKIALLHRQHARGVHDDLHLVVGEGESHGRELKPLSDPLKRANGPGLTKPGSTSNPFLTRRGICW
jgi:hypothetical protein